MVPFFFKPVMASVAGSCKSIVIFWKYYLNGVNTVFFAQAKWLLINCITVSLSLEFNLTARLQRNSFKIYKPEQAAMIFLTSLFLMPSNDFHLMIESLHILLLNLKYLPQDSKSLQAEYNPPTGFPPATRSQLSIPSKILIFNLSPLTSSKYSESSPSSRTTKTLRLMATST
jgi:hypothetical protein